MSTQVQVKAADPVVKFGDVLAELAIGPTAGCRLINPGKLHAKKLGGSTVVMRSELDRFKSSLPAYEPGRKIGVKKRRRARA